MRWFVRFVNSDYSDAIMYVVVVAFLFVAAVLQYVKTWEILP